MTDDNGSNPGPKADGIKYTEIRARTLGALEGSGPGFKRPIRKRGFHRALRAGKIWAVHEQGIRDMINRSWREMWADPNAPSGTVFMCGLSEFLIKKPEST